MARSHRAANDIRRRILRRRNIEPDEPSGQSRRIAEINALAQLCQQAGRVRRGDGKAPDLAVRLSASISTSRICCQIVRRLSPQESERDARAVGQCIAPRRHRSCNALKAQIGSFARHMGGTRDFAGRLHGEAHDRNGRGVIKAFDEDGFLRFRPGQHLHGDRGQGRKCAEGPCHQLRQVIAGDVLHHASARLEDLAASLRRRGCPARDRAPRRP